MSEVKWTGDQQCAIDSRGTVLVAAAAGSGKTAVLAQHVIDMITGENPVDVDRMLVLTFTRDAAAEMKNRIRKKLDGQLLKSPNPNLVRQKQKLYSAHISTTDSFCSSLVREHFSDLGIAPDFRIAGDDEIATLSEKALDSALEPFYLTNSPDFRRLLRAFASGNSDRGLRRVIMQLHRFLQNQPFGSRWLDEMVRRYTDMPFAETEWAEEYFRSLPDQLADLQRKCADCAANDLTVLPEKLQDLFTPLLQEDLLNLQRLEKAAEQDNESFCILADKLFRGGYQPNPALTAKDTNRIKGKVDKVILCRDSVRESVVAFLRAEDEIKDLSGMMVTLSETVRAYDRELSALKDRRSVKTFSDVSLLAVRLLAESCKRSEAQFVTGGFPYRQTPLAKELSARFAQVIIDEYQDVNLIQEVIYNCVSDSGKNLFAVGDIKQSIYGFRQSKAKLFAERRSSYQPYDKDNPQYPAVIYLSKNFRSRQQVCDTVNFIFSRIMPDYTPEEYLNFGAEGYAFDSACDTELALIEKSNFDESSSKTALEARYTASRIWQMINAGVTVTEGDHKRPITFRDFAVLMRAKSGASNEDESKQKGSAEFVRQLAQYGIPAYCEESGDFFRAQEIRLVLNLLRVIDNPSNDVALLAVLLSPLFGFTPDDLAVLRLAGERASLYRCLNLCREDDSATGRRSGRFLTELSRLRDLAAVSTVDDLLEALYERTAIIAVTSAINGGKAPARNLDLMRVYARKFASNGYKTLSDFNSYIDRLMQSEKQLASASDAQGGAADCVQVMSIHKSKGLEYPVCFLVDTAREFNMMDLKEPILMDSEAYVGVKPYINYARRSTFPYTAIRMRKKRESIDEEMRMLYVALTRAKEKLIIVGTAEEAETKLFKPIAAKTAGGRVEEKDVYAAKSMLEWLLLCAAVNPSTAGVFAGDRAGESDTNWILHKIMTEEELYSVGERAEQEEDNSEKEIKPDYAALLRENLAFVYPDADIIGIPQKVNPSQVSHSENREFTARALVMPVFAKDAQKRSPTEIGTAHHEFLHYCDFNAARADIEAEIARLRSAEKLTERQCECLDRAKLQAILENPLFERIISVVNARPEDVFREKQFTVFVHPSLTAEDGRQFREDRKQIVDGEVDLCFIEDGALVIVDYKTDRVRETEELRRHKPQLDLYEQAMTQILNLPVREKIVFSITLNDYIVV